LKEFIDKGDAAADPHNGSRPAPFRAEDDPRATPKLLTELRDGPRTRPTT